MDFIILQHFGLSNSTAIKAALTELLEKEGRLFCGKVGPLLGSGATSAILGCAPRPRSGSAHSLTQIHHTRRCSRELPQIPKLSAAVPIPASIGDPADGWDSPKTLALLSGSCISAIIAWTVHHTQIFASLRVLCKDSSHSAECNSPLRMSHLTSKRVKSPLPTVHRLIFHSNPEQGLCFTAACPWSVRSGLW